MGKYSVPGSGAVYTYAGVIEGVTRLQLGPGVYCDVTAMRVI